MNMTYLTNANYMYMVSLMATHKEQIIDVILTSSMVLLRGFLIKRKFRNIFIDIIICALWSWYMKDLLVIFMRDGALSPLICMALGYMGSNASARVLKLRAEYHLRRKR
ncbi:phage holin family protein [Enterobacter bugandensis]|uniref:phage holin family protein n=1 Tax=Enterobacter bugandensis TaxID=881260 RepID=UPI0020046A2C|nr:phage holin family protein [Enterobacter bugandensis]MCK6879718.1 phage holin family protein [Enterobacter bugandensis]